MRSLLVWASHLLPKAWKRDIKWTLGIPDMAASLTNMKRLGFSPRIVLDIGAYDGDWTRMCKSLFPSGRVLMFEPQPDKTERLKRLANELQGVQLAPVLLGREPKDEIPFHMFESGSSIYQSDSIKNATVTKLPMTTLAAATLDSEFARPDLIKIDVQGAELDVLSGGLDVTRSAEAIIMEVTLIGEYKGSVMMEDMIAFMKGQGLRVYDVCTIWRNTPSRSTNELDLIFVRESSPLWDSRHYRR